jgi:hypothetical protein
MLLPNKRQRSLGNQLLCHLIDRPGDVVAILAIHLSEGHASALAIKHYRRQLQSPFCDSRPTPDRS